MSEIVKNKGDEAKSEILFRDVLHLGTVLFSMMMLQGLLPSLQSLATWESENKIHCQQTLVDGDGPKTYWTRELNGDELTLVNLQSSRAS